MRLIAIPARFGSKRLPGKPLRLLGGKPILKWVYEKALMSKKKDRIIIATDDERIRDLAQSFGCDVVMTGKEISSGTERVFEATKDLDAKIIINLQGDEPFMDPSLIDKLFDYMEETEESMATFATKIFDDAEYKNPQCVKVVLDKYAYALYFSRSPIPYFVRKERADIYKHIGIYAYRKEFLEKFVKMERGILEEAESLEQLRVLENGFKIKVLLVEYSGFGIDTQEDLERAERMLLGLQSSPCQV
ncbi:MAG: 3-deoxy-manno-octulosonate cytidylyltransferase [Desulfobacterota bacterium]|nr:3-deoxy-manno-octulosonate cytidylyltransferase [Thermodesulfobacteriota bacterium]MDW8001720.1 3-deoxy-manno-octulosonate cytidylyltransferase [Deltaproteobacteria bacterium]